MHSQTSHVKQSHDSIFTQDRASFRLIPHALFRRELFGDLPCVDVLDFVNEVGACLAAVERLTTRVSAKRGSPASAERMAPSEPDSGMAFITVAV